MRADSTIAYMFVFSLVVHVIGFIIWADSKLTEIDGVHETGTPINITIIGESEYYRPKYSEKNINAVDDIQVGQKYQTTTRTSISENISVETTQRLEQKDFATLDKKPHQVQLSKRNLMLTPLKAEFHKFPPANDPYAAHVKDNYLSGLRKHIIEQKYYPLRARRLGKQGRVSVAFVIYRDGHIENIIIELSSGKSILDLAAYKSIQLMGSYFPFPDDIIEAQLTVAVHMNYSLQ